MDGAQHEAGRGVTVAPMRLRVLVADEQPEPLERIAEVARGLGHDVVALEVAVSGAARAIREQSPELAIVVLHENPEHALELVVKSSTSGSARSSS